VEKRPKVIASGVRTSVSNALGGLGRYATIILVAHILT